MMSGIRDKRFNKISCETNRNLVALTPFAQAGLYFIKLCEKCLCTETCNNFQGLKFNTITLKCL